MKKKNIFDIIKNAITGTTVAATLASGTVITGATIAATTGHPVITDDGAVDKTAATIVASTALTATAVTSVVILKKLGIIKYRAVADIDRGDVENYAPVDDDDFAEAVNAPAK